MSMALDRQEKFQAVAGDLIDEFAVFRANERKLEDSNHPESGSPAEAKPSTRQRLNPDTEPRT